MKKVLIIIIIIITILVGFLFYQSANNQPIDERESQVLGLKAETLVIIHQGSWFGDAPLYLAKELGFYEKYGIKVEINKVEEAQARRQLLSSGRADISAETIDMAVLDYGAGVEGEIFMALDSSLGADGIVAAQEIINISDLKGKKVAVSKGDPPYFLLLYLLKEQGISPEEIIFQEMPNVDIAATTFLSGQVDAAGTWEPWLSRAGERVGGHVLISSRDAPGIIVDVAVARPDVLKNRKKEVVGMMNAWFDAIEYWRQNPNEAVEIMAKEYGLSVEEFSELIETIRWDDRDSNMNYFGTRENKGKIFEVTQTIIDIAKQQGIINKKFEAEEIINLDFLEEN